MTGKTSGDSSPGVSGNIFCGIQDSFTTQGLGRNPAGPATQGSHLGVNHPPQPGLNPIPAHALAGFGGAIQCPTRCFATTPS